LTRLRTESPRHGGALYIYRENLYKDQNIIIWWKYCHNLFKISSELLRQGALYNIEGEKGNTNYLRSNFDNKSGQNLINMSSVSDHNLIKNCKNLIKKYTVFTEIKISIQDRETCKMEHWLYLFLLFRELNVHAFSLELRWSQIFKKSDPVFKSFKWNWSIHPSKSPFGQIVFQKFNFVSVLKRQFGVELRLRPFWHSNVRKLFGNNADKDLNTGSLIHTQS